MISVVLGEYKISFFSPFRKTSFGWNGGHIVGLDIVSFLAIRRMQTRITANTMGITISKTVTHTFLFWRSQFFHKSKINCLPRPAILKAANAFCLSVYLYSTLFTVNEEKKPWQLMNEWYSFAKIHCAYRFTLRADNQWSDKIQCRRFSAHCICLMGFFRFEKKMYHW